MSKLLISTEFVNSLVELQIIIDLRPCRMTKYILYSLYEISSTESRYNKKSIECINALSCAPQVGLEPTTLRLTAECSAIELLRNIGIGK